MRDYQNITVRAAALHIVAPRDGRLTITTAKLDLTEDVGEFLAEHVTKGLADPQASAATFVTRDPDRAGGLADAILEGRTDLLDGSAGLARLLYDATKDDARVPDGTLAVMECVTDTGQTFVAMLKLDPSDQYSAIADHDDDGNPVVRLEIRDDVLPSVRERVQKAVFVRPAGEEYDMLVVDRQRRGTEVSQYFVRDFLQAETVLDAPGRTKRLYKVLTHARNEVAGQLDDDELNRLTRYIDGAIAGQHVVVDDIVDGLPVPDDTLRKPFRERVDADLPDREFDLDEATVTSLVRRRVYTGDHGLRISYLSDDAPADMIHQRPPDDGDGRWTITIRTRRWDRK